MLKRDAKPDEAIVYKAYKHIYGWWHSGTPENSYAHLLSPKTLFLQHTNGTQNFLL